MQFAAALQVQFSPQAEVYCFGDEFAAVWLRRTAEDEALGREIRSGND
ncbi:hypothetical protein [Deinococcus alpinitundrae]|nr:hypothetical protein [Deinococcus alpinitundrae]